MEKNSVANISVEMVDVDLLNDQRKKLHELLVVIDPKGKNDLWGLLGLLDYICDKYEHLITPSDFGTCDTCEKEYELSSREGRCGDCGECAEHCTHKTCNCGCGCEVPLDWGTCVDCGDGTHQNNNELSEYKN
jgi:hypothetical protein